MGTCMSKKNVHQPIRVGKNPSKDTTLLLDQWNERHIELLKIKFQESLALAREKKIKIQGLDKVAFMKVFADLKTFPKQVAESAFKLFDRDRSGFIDFREFCCGLSIICLSSNNEKIRFIFDLFDLDRDGYLNRQELRTLLETSVVSFRKFCIGPGDQIDKMWIEHNTKVMFEENLPLTGIQAQSVEQRIDFHTFRQWAEYNLNVHHLLHTFELVPSPVRERKTIIDILQSYQRDHGDTMYAISYRWWDMWKSYTSQHFSTQDQLQFIDQIKQKVTDNIETPEYIKNFLIAYYEEQKEADINEVIQKNEFMDYNSQALRREYSKAILTPRSQRGNQSILDVSRPEEQCDIENSIVMESGRKLKTLKGQSLMNMKLKDKLNSKRSSHYSSSFELICTANKILLQSFQKKESLKFNPSSSQQLLLKKESSAGNSKLKQIQAKDHIDVSMQPINSEPSQDYDADSNLRFSQSFKQMHQVERPQEIDNSDIEGEHPGQLKPNLIMHRDFVMIPEEAWKCLASWYGGGPAFPRKVLINNMIPTIELYPPLITSVLAGPDGNPVQNSARSLFVSIAMKLSEVFLKICESFNYISTKDTRLWFKEGGHEWILIYCQRWGCLHGRSQVWGEMAKRSRKQYLNGKRLEKL
eukprot:403375058